MTDQAFLTPVTTVPVEVAPRQTVDWSSLGASLVRREGTHRLGKRWLARSHDDGRPLLVYELMPSVTLAAWEAVLARGLELKHRHALPVERVVRQDGEPRWIVCPYPGTHEGVMSLDQLLTKKPGGRLSKIETSRALRQLLRLQHEAMAAGVMHGPIRLEEVLIDRHGRVLVELYGLEIALRVRRMSLMDDMARAEVRAIFEIGRELVTGATGGDATLGFPRELWPDAPRDWRTWLAIGAIKPGYASALEAIARMPV